MPKKSIRAALDRLAAAEEEFLRQEFLAPVLRGGEVRIRLAGVICQLRIGPRDFQGWGVFRPLSHREAVLVRPARLAERRQYLDLFPLVRLIAARNEGGQWLAAPAQRGDGRFHIEGLVPLALAEEIQPFDLVQARFDGSAFWFDALDPRGNPATAAWLRESLAALTPPERLQRPGLTAEERAAYALEYLPRLAAQLEATRDRTEERLRAALQHAGAELVDYLERRDGYRITYTVDGRQHVSSVDKRDLTVQAAGICLAGRDAHFDLQSLVGVLREAERPD